MKVVSKGTKVKKVNNNNFDQSRKTNKNVKDQSKEVFIFHNNAGRHAGY